MMLKRPWAAFLSALVLIQSPGFECYEVWAASQAQTLGKGRLLVIDAAIKGQETLDRTGLPASSIINPIVGGESTSVVDVNTSQGPEVPVRSGAAQKPQGADSLVSSPSEENPDRTESGAGKSLDTLTRVVRRLDRADSVAGSQVVFTRLYTGTDQTEDVSTLPEVGSAATSDQRLGHGPRQSQGHQGQPSAPRRYHEIAGRVFDGLGFTLLTTASLSLFGVAVP